MKLKKKLIVIACITLVIIASVDAAEKDASEKKAAKKKKNKSKKVKNVQADDAQAQNQQPNYPEYPDNYDYNDNDYEEPENGGPGERILPLPVFTFSRFRRWSRKKRRLCGTFWVLIAVRTDLVYISSMKVISRDFCENLTYFWFFLEIFCLETLE